MAVSKVVVVDGNNLIVRIDRGVAGRGITDVEPITIDNQLYLEFTFSDGTTETVGPVGTVAYVGQSPIVITGPTISLSTVPVNLGGTGATTAANARTNLNAANQDTTITAGTGLSGGGSLAADRTLSIANTAVTAAAYGSASKTLTATVNAQGQLTALADTNIAIANTQISGLGTMSTQNATSVAITGGSITGITDLAVTDGGTGASDASGARTNLGAAASAITISAGTGLSGGGDLSANRTLSIADTAVTAAAYGSASNTLTATVNAQGQLTALAATPIAIANTQVSGLGTASVLNAGVALGVATLDAGGTVPLSQIPASIQGGVSYQGSWNAATNTPTLTSSVGSKGYYYVVSVAGSTNLNGITDWLPGDWAIFNGTVWEKIDNTDTVASVNGYVGAVVLTAADVGAPPTTRTISAGTGLTGGGDLSANRTITLADTTVTAGAYGSASAVPTYTVNAQGQLTAASNTTIAITNTQVSGLGTMSTQNANAVAITGGTATLTSLTVNDNATFGSSNTDDVTFTARIASEFSPAADNTYDLGRTGHEWRDLFIDGTANIDSLIADTADINGGTIDGTSVGATTASTGAFTSVTSSTAIGTASGGTGLGGATPFTANGVVYASSTSALATGSALTFDGTKLNLTNGSSSGIIQATDTASTGSFLRLLADAVGGNAINWATGTALRFATSDNAFGSFVEQARLTSSGLEIKQSQLIGYNDYTGIGTNGLAVAGNVGVGTASPFAKLQVVASSADYFNPQVMVGEASNATGKQLHIGYNTTANTGYIQAVHNGTGYKDLLLQPNGGNLGLGVTPSDWSSASRPALQLPNGAALFTRSGSTFLGQNFFYNNSDTGTYIANGFATIYNQASGQHQWFNAPSGTANNTAALTQAMTLDADGDLGIGTTSPFTRLESAAARATTLNSIASFNTMAASVTDTTPYAVGVGGGINFRAQLTSSSYNTYASIWSFRESANIADYKGSLIFGTSDNADGYPEERMRLDSAGNLGLGVTPSAQFASYRSFQFGTGGNLIGRSDSLGIELSSNSFRNTAAVYNYLGTGEAAAYRQYSGQHEWYSAPSGTAGNAISFTQAMTLNASGNLVVGATSATCRMEVVAPSGDNIVSIFRSGDATAANNAGGGFRSISSATAASRVAQIWLDADGANLSGGDYFFIQKNGNSGTVEFNQFSNAAMTFLTNNTERGQFSSDGTFRVKGAGTAGSTDAFQVAGTAPADAARIDSSGNLLVGTASTSTPGCVLAAVGRVSGTVASISTACFQAWSQATSGDNIFQEFYTEGGGGSLRGSISYNRAGGLTAYNVTSDYRAKDIYGPVADSGALIDSVPVYMGKMKGATQERPMFIAHEVPAYAHTGEKDAVDADGKPVYQQMDASALIPVMWAEIQDLRKRLAAAGI